MTSTTFSGLWPGARVRFERARVALDRQVLRWQGRLDTRGVDQVTPWFVAALLFVLLLLLALARSRSLDMGSDLAAYAQATWQIGEGLKPEISLTGGNLLAEQGAFILYPLGVLTSVLPRVTTLLTLQSMALALGVVPLWRIARRHGNLRIGATSAVAFAYCFSSAVHAMNVADFHPEVLAVPALMGAVLAGLDDRKRATLVLVVIVLACRADLALAIAGLGILLAIEGRRRLGGLCAAIGFVWLFVALYIVQPSFASGAYPHLEAFEQFGASPHGVLWGIVSSPLEFLGLIASEGNFLFVVTLLAPVLFLPVTAPRYLLPVVPLYLIYLAADVDEGRLANAPQTVPISVFVFVATVFALKRTGSILVERVNVDRRLILALVLTAFVFFMADSVSSPYERPWSWGGRDAVDVARLEAAALVDTEAKTGVRASRRLLPLLTERVDLYELDTSGDGPDVDAAVVDNAIVGVDWILLDRTAAPQWTEVSLGVFRARLRAGGWLQVYPADPAESVGIELFRYTGVIESLDAVEPG